MLVRPWMAVTLRLTSRLALTRPSLRQNAARTVSRTAAICASHGAVKHEVVSFNNMPRIGLLIVKKKKRKTIVNLMLQ
jgi:hypothetical protein